MFTKRASDIGRRIVVLLVAATMMSQTAQSHTHSCFHMDMHVSGGSMSSMGCSHDEMASGSVSASSTDHDQSQLPSSTRCDVSGMCSAAPAIPVGQRDIFILAPCAPHMLAPMGEHASATATPEAPPPRI